MKLFKTATKLLLALAYVMTFADYNDTAIVVSVYIAAVLTLYYLTKFAYLDDREN